MRSSFFQSSDVHSTPVRRRKPRDIDALDRAARHAEDIEAEPVNDEPSEGERLERGFAMIASGY